VTQLTRVDISRNQKRQFFVTVVGVPLPSDGCIHSVRVAVLEEAVKIWIFNDVLKTCHCVVYEWGPERAAGWYGSLVGEIISAGRKGRMILLRVCGVVGAALSTHQCNR